MYKRPNRFHEGFRVSWTLSQLPWRQLKGSFYKGGLMLLETIQTSVSLVQQPVPWSVLNTRWGVGQSF